MASSLKPFTTCLIGLGLLLCVPGPGDAAGFEITTVVDPEACMAGQSVLDLIPQPDPQQAQCDESGVEVLLLDFETFSQAEPREPDEVFCPYTVRINLTDLDSGTTRQISFNGVLEGTISRLEVDIAHSFTGATERSVTVGRARYRIRTGEFLPPGPPDTPALGALTAFVACRELTAAEIPEPGTIALLSLGAPVVGALLLRRRRR